MYRKHAAVGIVHFMAYPETMRGTGPILESLSRIAEDSFFDAIEVGHIEDNETRRSAARLLRQAHLRVGFGAQPMLLGGGHDLNSLDEKQRQQAIEVIRHAVDEAKELGAERLALLSGPAPEDPIDRPDCIEALTDSLVRICEYSGGELGITLETFDGDIDKCALVGNDHQEAAAVAKAVRGEGCNFGLLVDLSHLPQQRDTAAHALEATREFLVHAHVGNCVLKKGNPAFGDKHPRFGIEEGENDVPELREFLQVLAKIGFLNAERPPMLGFEVFPTDGEPPSVLIANAKRTFLQAWSGLEGIG